MKNWKIERNRNLRIEPISYTKEILAKYSDKDVRIYVGCDSQNIRRKPWTGYVTCIAYHIGTQVNDEFFGTGVHVIYTATKVPKIKDTWSKLWKEVELSMEVAEKLRKSGLLIYQVDLDFNQDETHDSHRLVSAGEGLFTGLGYNVKSKPDELIAARAADHLLHSISWKRIPLTKQNK